MNDVRDNQDEGRFEIALDDGQIAFAEYRLAGERIIFPHTVVPQEHEGQGIASRLARHALAFARDQRLSVVPLCAFFREYMKRHPDTHNLLAPEGRTMVGV